MSDDDADADATIVSCTTEAFEQPVIVMEDGNEKTTSTKEILKVDYRIVDGKLIDLTTTATTTAADGTESNEKEVATFEEVYSSNDSETSEMFEADGTLKVSVEEFAKTIETEGGDWGYTCTIE